MFHTRPARKLAALLLAALAGSAAAATTAVGTGAPTASPAPAATPPVRGSLYLDGPTHRYLLGGTWQYRADPGDVGVAQGWWQPDAPVGDWSQVSVPNAYNAGNFSSASMAGWVGWYRRDFVLPADAFPQGAARAARAWIIRFESANYTATVWVNGRRLGGHEGPDLPFEFRLPPLRPGVNHLVVRVDNRRSALSVPPGPGGGWWNDGGLLREVYLEPVQDADLQGVIVRPLLPCARCAATIRVSASVVSVSSRPATVSLRGSFGGIPLSFGTRRLPAGGRWQAQDEVVIAHPRLWAPGHPALYRTRLTLSDGSGRPVGGYVTLSGIRRIVVVGGHLEINGRRVHLRGIDLHEQSLATGAALSPAQLAGIMQRVREVGATIIRSHYPLNPQLLEAADRDGILVWSEVPLWRASRSALGTTQLTHQAESELRQSIATNQNHPSILLWSIGNELPTPATADEAAYVRTATSLVRRLDPTRPVAMAVSDWPGVGCQRAYGPLDVIGVNEYFGWMDVDGGTTDDRDALSPFLDGVHRCYPRKALFVTEFGVEANRPGPSDERGTYAFQVNALQYHLAVYATKPWLSGALLWVLQDFAAFPGWDGNDPRGTPPFVQKGLFDLQGNPKPAEAVVAEIYRETQQIAPARDSSAQ